MFVNLKIMGSLDQIITHKVMDVINGVYYHVCHSASN